MAGAAILRRGGRFPTWGSGFRGRRRQGVWAPALAERPGRGARVPYGPRMHAPRSRPRRQSGGQRRERRSPRRDDARSRDHGGPEREGRRRGPSPGRGRQAPSPSRPPSWRDRRFANLRNSVRTLYESREQNVFGGTESGYTALCGDKNESTAMTNAPRPYCAGRPRRAAPPDGIARDCVRVASTRVWAGSSDTPSPATLRTRPEKTIGESKMAPHLLENTRNRVGNGRPRAGLDPGIRMRLLPWRPGLAVAAARKISRNP